MALARVLARDPGVLLLDEPLSALDARTRAGAARELAEVLRDLEVPALLVTHDFSEAAQLGDRVGVIDAGKVIQEGTPTELAARPAPPSSPISPERSSSQAWPARAQTASPASRSTAGAR